MLAQALGVSPEEMARQLVLENFSNGVALEKIEEQLTDTLSQLQIDYSRLDALEREKKELEEKLNNASNNKAKAEIQKQLSEVEGQIQAEKQRILQEVTEFKEEVFKSSSKGFAEYAQKVRDAIDSANFSEDQRVLKDSIMEFTRNRMQELVKKKEMREYFLKILLDPSKNIDDRFVEILKTLNILGLGNANEFSIAFNKSINGFPQEKIRIFSEMIKDPEFRREMGHMVSIEGLAGILLKDPKALQGVLTKENATALVQTGDLIVDLIKAARVKAEEGRERLKELEEQGLIKKGAVENMLDWLKPL